MNATSRILASLLALIVLQAAGADAPKVIQATPDNGAKDVDAGSKEIRIVFDQPMAQGGWSMVGGGPTFPKLAGKGRWVDDRTLVWSWQLEPDHDYWLSINSSRFTNLRNRQGEPAVPYPIAFRRGSRPGGGKASTPSEKASPERNRAAVEHL
jgi:hypothetical protein